MSVAIYLAGLCLIAAVGWVVAGPLLSGGREAATTEEESVPHERLRRQKEEALDAIRDAEFDRELGKLSEDDYRELRERLESEAVTAMGQLEKPDDGNAR